MKKNVSPAHMRQLLAEFHEAAKERASDEEADQDADAANGADGEDRDA